MYGLIISQVIENIDDFRYSRAVVPDDAEDLSLE